MTTKKNLDEIDFLRGFAILTIVLFHLFRGYLTEIPNVLQKAVMLGGTGVHIFMVCSGFGLLYSQLNKPLNYIQFLKKRFTKIYIPYIIVVLIAALFPFIYTGNDKIVAILSHIFLFKMFFANYVESFGPQLWFISTIIQFYICFHLLVKIKQKVGNRGFLIISFLTSLAWWIFVAANGKVDVRTWNSFFLQYLWEFSIGMVLADVFHKNRNSENNFLQFNKIILFLTATLGLLTFAFFGMKGGIFRVFNDVPALLGYGALSLLIFSFKVKAINKLFAWINNFSYEWFLIHMLVFSCVFHLFDTHNIIVGVIALGLSMLVAYLYNFLIKTCDKKLNFRSTTLYKVHNNPRMIR